MIFGTSELNLSWQQWNLLKRSYKGFRYIVDKPLLRFDNVRVVTEVVQELSMV